jgi:hypothetical protein
MELAYILLYLVSGLLCYGWCYADTEYRPGAVLVGLVYGLFGPVGIGVAFLLSRGAKNGFKL